MAQQNMVQTNAAPQQNVNLQTNAAPKSANAQKLSLSGGNAAQKQYLSYYNQILSQLGSSSGYTPIETQVIEAPEKLTAHLVTAQDPIESERVNWDRVDLGQYANELDSYFQPYLQNSIKKIWQNAADQRAGVDVDAYSRGLGSSSFGIDAKNTINKAATNAVQSATSEYWNQLGQQAMGMWNSNEERAYGAALSNAERADAIAQFNASMQDALDKFNASAQTDADKYNLDMAVKVAMENAGLASQTDMFNAQMQSDWEQYLQQLAWGWAGQMYGTNPVTRTVVKDLSGVENTESIWDKARGVLQGIGLGSSALGSAAQGKAASAVDAVQAALAAAQAQASSLTPGSTYQSTKNKTSTVAGGTKVKQTK